MEKELEQFRQEVERLRVGRQRGSLPYPQTLRAFAVRYVAHTLETGGTFAGVAKALGVSEPTLQAWRKGHPATTCGALGSPPSRTRAPLRSRNHGTDGRTSRSSRPGLG